MAMTDAERQALCQARKKEGLDLGDLDDRSPIKPGQMTPLEYMLSVINDPSAEKNRRDRMAQAAAPYVHAKIESDGHKTKKQEKEAAAEEASEGMFAPAEPPKTQPEYPTTYNA